MTQTTRTGQSPLGRALLLGGWMLAGVGCEAPSSPSMEALAAKGGGGTSVTVTAADPDTVPIDTTLTVRIIGNGFVKDPKTTVTYLLNGIASVEVRATLVEVVSATEIRTTTAISESASLGKYSIAVVTGGKRGVGAEKVEVVAKPVFLDELTATTSYAVDVNDDGVIVGELLDGSGNSLAVRWRPGNGGWIADDLGAGSAGAVNGNGEILVNRPDNRVHVRLANDTEVDLGEGTRGSNMSEDGTVVGSMSIDGTWTAVLWPRTGHSWGPPVAIPGLAGYDELVITGMSRNHQWISGYTYNNGGTAVGVVWEWDGTNVVGPWLVDDAPAQPQMVSNDGAIAGVAWLPCETPGFCYMRPAFWPYPGGPRQLIPIPRTDHATMINDMNDRHQMVGMGLVPIPTNGRKSFFLTQQPALWPTAAADVVDLSAFKRPRIGKATAIDGAGRLVVGDIDGHAIAWILP